MRFIIYLLIFLSVNCERNNITFPNCKECSKSYLYNNNNILYFLNNKIKNNINTEEIKYDFNKYFFMNNKKWINNLYSQDIINIYKMILLLQI
jgi:hypothetical protein